MKTEVEAIAEWIYVWNHLDKVDRINVAGRNFDDLDSDTKRVAIPQLPNVLKGFGMSYLNTNNVV
jgi:hypothetical protein